MRRIAVADETVMPFSPAVVWKTLADFESSPTWWRPQVTVVIRQVAPDLVGSILEVRPLGGMGFVCRVSAVKPEAEMKLQYIEGIYRGTGVWTLTPTESGTLLRYAIDLEIVSRLLIALSFFVDLGAIHSRLMKQVFVNLESHMARSLA